VRAVAAFPLEGLAIVVTWLLVGQVKRLLAMPAAVAVTVGLMAVQGAGGGDIQLWQDPVLVTPAFTLPAMIGVALPLFIVTMASQNIPGIAILKVNGYAPDPNPLFRNTGFFSLLSAPFGGHAVNLAAITAALCAGEEAGPDRDRRYWSAVVAGAAYILLGLSAGAATAFIAASPALLIEAVAGLALLAAFGGALLGAMSAEADREAAVICFLVTASGLSFLGISGAFWGLVAGGAVLALKRWRMAAQASR
jgi:benzoate membrane transport protein